MPDLHWEVDGFRFTRRPSDPGPYLVLRADVVHPKVGTLHHVELTASPDDGSVAGRLQQPAGDPERTGGGDNGDAVPGVDGTPSPAASKPLSNEQKAMHAKAGELVKAGVWPKPDADMLRKGVISAITGGDTDSSHQLDRDAMSDVLDALDAIAAGDLEVHRRATGEWSIDPVRRRREVAS